MSAEVRSNLVLVARERGKITARYEGHNIWLRVGRSWMARLISYTSFTPLTPEEDSRISYIGFGIGGNRQGSIAVVDNSPMVDHYPGTNVQHDRDLFVDRLERPVRVGWTVGPNPPVVGGGGVLTYEPDDVWLAQIDIPTHPTPSSLRITALLQDVDVNDPLFYSIPLSEIGLFDRSKSVNVYDNEPLAYDTFPTFLKGEGVEINVSWTIRF